MERLRFRPWALAVVLGAAALIPMVGSDAFASATPTHDFGFSRGLSNVQVLPSLLPNSKENTSVIAQNNGSAAATIVMDIYTPAGVLVPSASIPFSNVPPGATRVFAQAINSGLVQGFRGVGVISSDQPINALLVRDIEQQGTGTKSYSIHNAYATGGTKLALTRARITTYVRVAVDSPSIAVWRCSAGGIRSHCDVRVRGIGLRARQCYGWPGIIE